MACGLPWAVLGTTSQELYKARLHPWVAQWVAQWVALLVASGVWAAASRLWVVLVFEGHLVQEWAQEWAQECQGRRRCHRWGCHRALEELPWGLRELLAS